MKRFIITGNFPGEIYAIYSDKEIAEGQERIATLQLADIDFRAADPTALQVDYLKSYVPSTYTPAAFKLFIEKLKLSFIIEGVEITLDEFLDRYGRRINVKRCIPLWGKLAASTRNKALAGVTPYLDYLKRVGFRAQADPETYLKKEYWLTDWRNLNS